MAAILICDDNPNIRYLLRVFVESQTPFKICGEAGHGIEAIEKARHLQPDLILLDFSMPAMTGADVATVMNEDDAAHENHPVLNALRLPSTIPRFKRWCRSYAFKNR